MVNAPTGSGKTLALMLPAALKISEKKDRKPAVKLIWISPVRALAKQIHQVGNELIESLELPINCGMRTGDTKQSERKKQLKSPPEILVTTPESLHQWIANPNTARYLKKVDAVVVDEWHELEGSKRGVQMELALAWLRNNNPALKTWAISATISDPGQSAEILLGSEVRASEVEIVKADIQKEISIETLMPEDIFELPWVGHIGIKLLEKVAEKIKGATNTLVFTNTRSQCEIWYQRLLEHFPELAGQMAMHHSAIDEDIRAWVEESLHSGRLKVVVCTSSLDLGVDFRPVELIVQIGGPKGVSRFIQRAGRSGHSPGQPSRICFVPTHAIELLEAAALRDAVQNEIRERPEPHIRSFDVLVQFMMTLAVSEGFDPIELYKLVKSTYSYRSVSREEWGELINLILKGGNALEAYSEYARAGIDSTGKVRVLNKKIARRHLMSMGTITGDQALVIKYRNGKKLGTVEEWFVANLRPGEVFWFAGRALELIGIKGNKVEVSRSSASQAKVPAWMGGRLPLSSMMSETMRAQLLKLVEQNTVREPELSQLKPLMDIQLERSAIPVKNQLLIEYYKSREGYHLIVYPFEGRLVHEGLAALLASRIAKRTPITFSIAMNDYGFELLAAEDWEPEKLVDKTLFSTDRLSEDISKTIAETQMVRRTFRDIAMISGLLFRGFPGREKKERHLQSSAALLFDVFNDYDPGNLLFLQAWEEVKTFQLEEGRMRKTLERIAKQEWVFKRPGKFTPLALPLIADRLRDRLSSEKVEMQLRKMMAER